MYVRSGFIKDIVYVCVGVGITTLGLYRTGGVNSKVQRLMTSVFGKKCFLYDVIFLTW